MANERKGAYSEVESLKKGKHQIAKDYRRIELLLSAGGTVVFMIFFSKDLLSKDIFSFSILRFFQDDVIYTGNFNYKLFYIVMILLFLYSFLFVTKKDLKRLKMPKFSEYKEAKKRSFLKMIFFFIRYFILFIINSPFIALSKVFNMPSDIENKVGIEMGYLNKLEKKFFYQILEKEDGYSRAKELTIFKNRRYLFGEEYDDIFKLFRSQKHFDDLFLIIEGYLDKSHLYDTKLYKKGEDILPDSLIKKINNNAKKEEEKIGDEKNYKYFQTYMLRENKDGILTDNVTISLNAMVIFMSKQKALFKKHIANYFSFKNGISTVKKEAIERLITLAKDVHFRKKITKGLDDNEQKRVIELLEAFEYNIGLPKVRGANQQKKETLIDDDVAFSYLSNMLMADFTFVLFRMIISRFMNLPAGTIVVKIESYDTRMIIEYYKQLALIDIVENKNDGKSESFMSDNYVNLFMILFANFLNNKENGTFQELYFKFNTDESTKPMSIDVLKELIDTKGEKQTMSELNEKIAYQKFLKTEMQEKTLSDSIRDSFGDLISDNQTSSSESIFKAMQ